MPHFDVIPRKKALLGFLVEYSTIIEISDVEKYFFRKYVMLASKRTVPSLYFVKTHKDILFQNCTLQK